MANKKNWIALFETIEEYIGILALLIMTLLVIIQVCSRYIFSFSFVWLEELVRYLMIWMVMIGAALVQSKSDHIRIDFFPLLLNPRARIVLETVFRLFTLVFLMVILVKGVKIASFNKMFESSGLRISMFWPTLAIPVGAFLIAVYTVINLIRDIQRMFFWSTEQLLTYFAAATREKYEIEMKEQTQQANNGD